MFYQFRLPHLGDDARRFIYARATNAGIIAAIRMDHNHVSLATEATARRRIDDIAQRLGHLSPFLVLLRGWPRHLLGDPRLYLLAFGWRYLISKPIKAGVDGVPDAILVNRILIKPDNVGDVVLPGLAVDPLALDQDGGPMSSRFAIPKLAPSMLPSDVHA